MVKFIVMRGKVSNGIKTYLKGDTFDMAVKDAKLLPKSMIRRVKEPPSRATSEPDTEDEYPQVTI